MANLRVAHAFILALVVALLGACIKQKFSIPEKRIVVVIPSYNNSDWCAKNLCSVFSQQYTNYRVVYYDDCSTDDTFVQAQELVHTQQQEHRTQIIKSPVRVGALAHHYAAIQQTDPHEIIVSLDGDDWFAHSQVLQRINKEYQNPDIWLTYGQFQNWPTGVMGWCKQIPEAVVASNTFREFGFWSAQPRTYYAWLGKLINRADLLDDNGNFFTVAGDVALMFPLLEMAGHRFRFISDVLCIRNVATPINDFKVHRDEQKRITRFIRNKQKYQPIVFGTDASGMFKH